MPKWGDFARGMMMFLEQCKDKPNIRLRIPHAEQMFSQPGPNDPGSVFEAGWPAGSEDATECPEQESGKHHGHGKGEHPSQEQIADGAPL